MSEHHPRYIVTRSDFNAKPYAIYDVDNSREVASYADPRDVREALVTYYGWMPAQARAIDFDAIIAGEDFSTNPGNAEAAIIAELIGVDEWITDEEASAVLAWCREWVADCGFDDVEDALTLPDAVLLAGCHRHVVGGLSFVLADVRACADLPFAASHVGSGMEVRDTREVYEVRDRNARDSRAVLKCPECGEDVWDVPNGSKLAKCWNTEGHADGGTLAFDTMDEDETEDAPEVVYVVCSCCGHVVTADAERMPRDCENCYAASLRTFAKLDDAEAYSEHVLGDGRA